jgi:hypothetical protein
MASKVAETAFIRGNCDGAERTQKGLACGTDGQGQDGSVGRNMGVRGIWLNRPNRILPEGRPGPLDISWERGRREWDVKSGVLADTAGFLLKLDFTRLE